MLKIDRPLNIFDLETTSADIDTARVVQIAVLKIHPDGRNESMNHLVNPEIPIPKEASDIHGITDIMVAHKPTIVELSKEIFEFFVGCDVGGYNISKFDVPILWKILYNLGYSIEIPKIVDSYQIFIKDYPHDLQNAHKHYVGEEFEDAHDAFADVKATLSVLRKQVEKEGIPEDIDSLDTFCKREGQLDLMGKLRLIDGEVVMTFGKHKDRPVQNVERDYFVWCKRNNVFTPDGWAIIKDVMDKHRKGSSNG